MTKTIKGVNDPSDYDNVKDVIDNHPEVDDLVLTGAFYFGGKDAVGNDYPRKTVEITRGMTIRGTIGAPRQGVPPNPQRLQTLITGGGDEMPFAQLAVLDSGAFKVKTDEPVVIKDIWFAGWKGEAILVEACGGLRVTHCRFTHPVATEPQPLFNRATFVNAVFAIGPGCMGDFVAQGNICDLRQYARYSIRESFPLPPREPGPHAEPGPPFTRAYPPAHDEQFACCFQTKFTNISIVQNRVMGHDEGFEVMFNNLNDATLVPRIRLNDNFIALAQHPRLDPWPGSTGIVCCNNERADTQIKGNLIITTGSGGVALFLSGQHDPDHPFNVENNVSHQDGDPEHRHQAAIVMGSNYPVPFPPGVAPSSSPLSGARIVNNHFSGMAQFGIVTLDLVSLKDDLNITIPIANGCQWPAGLVYSQGNEVSGNNLFFLDCTAPQVLLTKGTSGNNVTGCFHPEALDLNRPNNTINPVCPPIGSQRLRLKLAEVPLLAEMPIDAPVAV